MAQVQGITTSQPTQAPVVVAQSSQQPGQNPANSMTLKADGSGQTAAPVTTVAAHGTSAASSTGITNSSNAGSLGAQPSPVQNMANPKEKTPMCLLNELARYNKTQPQYNLVDESGPAHQKIFTVSLTLNEKEYRATGTSIKKAQHEAANIALKECNLPKPKPRPPRVIINGNLDSMTPTVELNGIAMKRGEQAIYRPIEPTPALGPGPGPGPRAPPPSYYNNRPNYNFRGMYNQRYHYPVNRTCYVSLTVGNREFIGDGRTRQQARHTAAVKALKVLRNEPLPEGIKLQEPEKMKSEGIDSDDDDESKSEISQCYEISHRRNLPITFEVIKESGPPHMKTFVTRCTVGEYSAEAEGNGKKVSKKKAAAKVLDQLRELTPLPVIEKPRPRFKKKKPKSLVKPAQQNNQDYGLGMNPVSRLVQIQQAKKEKEPVFTLLQERGQPRKREFVMQVTVGNNQCTGIGPNKKMAKRAAAEAMLQELGYRSNPPLPNKSSLKTEGAEVQTPEEKPTNGRKVTFADSEKEDIKPSVPEGGSGGTLSSRPLAPGLLPMVPEVASAAGFTVPPMTKHTGLNRAPGSHFGDPASRSTTAVIAKELLNDGVSPTAEAMAKPGVTEQKLLRPKSQLIYLAKVQGLQYQFTDFPKGNKPEYLSLVSISTNPPLVSHGAGPTVESSHDAASLQALKSLMDMDIKGTADHIKKEPGTPPATSTRGQIVTGYYPQKFKPAEFYKS
ncbi:double-stranded RNA-binding protein Staufen homolog 2-like isoform X2 [Ptychodera flava]|uniref:double-stranded RNA-binding protein Staufen homolog 2-like isoform X2 n=1 Tax=Ptychodera flava TaxID=63121 RepID=UPI00396A93BC